MIMISQKDRVKDSAHGQNFPESNLDYNEHVNLIWPNMCEYMGKYEM